MPELGDELRTAVTDVARRQRRLGVDAAFRATMEERLRGIEADLSELKSRLNGLMLFIASTVLAQVLLRVVP